MLEFAKSAFFALAGTICIGLLLSMFLVIVAIVAGAVKGFRKWRR